MQSFTLSQNGAHGYTIIFMCDNETFVDALNKHMIKGEAIHILQLIYLAVALYLSYDEMKCHSDKFAGIVLLSYKYGS